MRPAVHVMAAAIWIYPLVCAQESVPTFGTTVVVPGGLVGIVYHIPPWSQSIPFFQTLDPVGVIYTASLNVPARRFTEGFPGVTSRFEWFAIDYTGRFWIERPGVYRFALTSDDGARLYVDGEPIVNNDGIHPPLLKTGTAVLNGGIHRIRVSYFQGPRDQVALVLQVAGPGEQFRVFSTDDFKPPPDPENWRYGSGDAVSAARLQVRFSTSTASAGDAVSAEIGFFHGPGDETIASRWELVIPAEILELITVEPGRAAKESGKSASCSKRKDYLYDCALSGDPHRTANGPIAILHLKVRPGAQLGATALRIEEAEATESNGRKLMVNGAEGILTIR